MKMLNTMVIKYILFYSQFHTFHFVANDESDDSNDSHDDEEDDDMEGNIDRTRNIIERIDYTYDPPDDTNNDIIQEVSPMA